MSDDEITITVRCYPRIVLHSADPDGWVRDLAAQWDRALAHQLHENLAAAYRPIGVP